MKKVCLVGFGLSGPFHGYELHDFDPASYFAESRRGHWRELVNDGLNGWDRSRALLAAGGVDALYRRRDPAYVRMTNDFVDRFADFDVIVLGYNCIHPEVLRRELSRPVKILGFVDDPYSTYTGGVPHLWAFDGAYYISPSYLDGPFAEALERWGCRHHHWWPLAPRGVTFPEVDDAFFAARDVPMVYVGKDYRNKLGRLARLKQRFGDGFQIHGRWSMKGWGGVLRVGQRVRPLSHEARTALYLRTQIGFNMHMSDAPTETGNMRMYEVPAHGAMLLCDKAAADAHARIFTPDREAVFYDSIEDAIDKAAYYLAHPAERLEIARRGFERARRDYQFDPNLRAFLDWASGLSALRVPGSASRARGS